MSVKTKIELPKGFEEPEIFYGPTFDDGIKILYFSCGHCTKEQDCKNSKTLRFAMGDNFPFWPDVFVRIKIETDPLYFRGRVICTEYKN